MKRILAILLTFIGIGILCGDLAAQNGFKRDLVLHYTFDKSETADKVDAANSTDSDQNNSDQNKSDEPSILNIAGNFHSGKPLRAKFVDEKSSGRSLRLRQNSEKSGYVETADHKDFKSAKFTVAAWIKLDRTGSNGSVVCKHDWFEGGARGFVLRCYNGKNLNFTVGAGGWKAVQGKSDLKAYQWTHVAGTFDGDELSVYVNGQHDGSAKVATPYTPSSYPLRIGHAAFSLDTHRKFDGKIDDVMIWKRCLTKREVQSVFESQKDSRPAPLTAKDIKDLIQQLGSSQFQKRIEAQRKLEELGGEVVPLLEEFQPSEDLEIKKRIKQVQRGVSRDR